MKFVDYEASHITPQLTLIKKFNELLKWVREKEAIYDTKIVPYKHTLSVYDGDGSYILELVSLSETPIEENAQLYEEAKKCFSFRFIDEDTNKFTFNIISFWYDTGMHEIILTYYDNYANEMKTKSIDITSDEVSRYPYE